MPTKKAKQILNGSINAHESELRHVLSLLVAENDECKRLNLLARNALEHGLTGTSAGIEDMRKTCQALNEALGDRVLETVMKIVEG